MVTVTTEVSSASSHSSAVVAVIVVVAFTAVAFAVRLLVPCALRVDEYIVSFMLDTSDFRMTKHGERKAAFQLRQPIHACAAHVPFVSSPAVTILDRHCNRRLNNAYG